MVSPGCAIWMHAVERDCLSSRPPTSCPTSPTPSHSAGVPVCRRPPVWQFFSGSRLGQTAGMWGWLAPSLPTIPEAAATDDGPEADVPSSKRAAATPCGRPDPPWKGGWLGWHADLKEPRSPLTSRLALTYTGIVGGDLDQLLARHQGPGTVRSGPRRSPGSHGRRRQRSFRGDGRTGRLGIDAPRPWPLPSVAPDDQSRLEVTGGSRPLWQPPDRG